GEDLGAVVGGENNNRVVELPHVFQLLEHEADVVVHLLHAGFVDAPVLAASLTDHGHILVRQHGRDVHAGRVVPDEERLVGRLGVVAAEPVNEVTRDFLVHRFGAFQGQRTFVLALLILGRAVRGFHPQDVPGRCHASSGFWIDRAGRRRHAGNRLVLAWRRGALFGRRLVDVQGAYLLHGIEVVQGPPGL